MRKSSLVWVSRRVRAVAVRPQRDRDDDLEAGDRGRGGAAIVIGDRDGHGVTARVLVDVGGHEGAPACPLGAHRDGFCRGAVAPQQRAGVGVEDAGVGEARRHQRDAAGIGGIGLGGQDRDAVAHGDRDLVRVGRGPVAHREGERVRTVIGRLEGRPDARGRRERDHRPRMAREGPRVGQVLAVGVGRGAAVERDDGPLVDRLVGSGVGGRSARWLLDDAATELEHVGVVVTIAAPEEVLEADLGATRLEEVDDRVGDAVLVPATGSHEERVAGIEDFDAEHEFDPRRVRPDVDHRSDITVRGEPLGRPGFEQPELAREAGRGGQDLDFNATARREELTAELGGGGYGCDGVRRDDRCGGGWTRHRAETRDERSREDNRGGAGRRPTTNHRSPPSILCPFWPP